MKQFQTIAAICTPPGTGGLSVIRLSGSDAFLIADQIFQAQNKKTVASMPGNTVSFGKIIDKTAQKILDEVVLTKFAEPHSFTGEDTVEISCHGGTVVSNMILELCIKNGAALARPGEFSKRSFLNGKMDLSKAEAVIELISAKSEDSVFNNALLLEGEMQGEVTEIRQKLIDTTAAIMAKVEYPDEDIDELFSAEVVQTLRVSKKKLLELIESYQTGKILTQGIKLAIVGRPNVGKSSIMNALLRENRAIVTEIEGTTRDIITEYVTIRGILFQLIDTAGIRMTEDQIEKIGVEKTSQAIGEADLILFVQDVSQEKQPEDEQIEQMLIGKKVLTVYNKVDLVSDQPSGGLLLSTKTGEGLEQLFSALADSASYPKEEIGNRVMLTNVRQKECLEHAVSDLDRALFALERHIAMDLAAIDIQQAVSDLGEVTGKTVSDEVIETIFARFCLGK